jgi:hypothetical protein
MSMRKGMKPGQGETRLAEAEVDGATEVYRPRKMTFAENVILTIKVLAGFGLLGAALWGISLWNAAR